MRALMAAVCGLLMSVMACTGAGSANPTSTSSEVGTSTTEARESSSPASTHDQDPAPSEGLTESGASVAFPPSLLASPEGVFVVQDGVLPARLLDGPAEIAVEDGAGGFLFQRSTFDVGVSGIFQISPEQPIPTELVGAAPDASLTLAGVTRGDGDDTFVWYSSWTGSTPETIEQEILRHSMASAVAESVATMSGWNSASVITPRSDLILIEWVDGDAHGFRFRDGAWKQVTVGANPYEPEGERSCEMCPRSATISDDGLRMAWIERVAGSPNGIDEVVVVDLSTRTELHRVSLGADAGPGAELDMHEQFVLVNTRDLDDDIWVPPLAISLEPDRIELLPIPGRGRILRTTDSAGGIAVP